MTTKIYEMDLDIFYKKLNGERVNYSLGNNLVPSNQSVNAHPHTHFSPKNILQILQFPSRAMKKYKDDHGN